MRGCMHAWVYACVWLCGYASMYVFGACVCACVHMHVLTHGCMHAGLDSWMHACDYGRTKVYAPMCACLCLYVHVYARGHTVCIGACTRACTLVCVFGRNDVCLYVYMHVLMPCACLSLYIYACV